MVTNKPTEELSNGCQFCTNTQTRQTFAGSPSKGRLSEEEEAPKIFLEEERVGLNPWEASQQIE